MELRVSLNLPKPHFRRRNIDQKQRLGNPGTQHLKLHLDVVIEFNERGVDFVDAFLVGKVRAFNLENEALLQRLVPEQKIRGGGNLEVGKADAVGVLVVDGSHGAEPGRLAVDGHEILRCFLFVGLAVLLRIFQEIIGRQFFDDSRQQRQTLAPAVVSDSDEVGDFGGGDEAFPRGRVSPEGADVD